MHEFRRRLVERIRNHGPLSVAEYMRAALQDPEFGYYRSGMRIGKNGDFVTSPEVSQVFGELLGLSLAKSWAAHGRPRPIGLVELGPGPGSLLADMLRATRLVEGFHGAFRKNLYLIESNEDFRRSQAKLLGAYEPEWIDRIDDMPELPMYLIANEFLDCLPVHVFRKSAGGWQEKQVTECRGRLTFAYGASDASIDLTDFLVRPDDLRVGSIVEISPQTRELALTIGKRIGRFGGTAIIIDYGGWGTDGFTLQAVRRHRKCPPLAYPGSADLTAHVDFRAVSKAAGAHARVSAMIEQGELLRNLGIAERMHVLAENLSGSSLQVHLAAHRRLTLPIEMGSTFKGISIVPDGAMFAPGFG